MNRLMKFSPTSRKEWLGRFVEHLLKHVTDHNISFSLIMSGGGSGALAKNFLKKVYFFLSLLFRGAPESSR